MLMAYYNGQPALVLGMLVALLGMLLFSLRHLPAWYQIRTEGQIRPEGTYRCCYAAWSLCLGFVTSTLVFIFWRPQHRVFLDRICVDQTCSQMRAEAVLSLAGLLKRSDSMLILWDPTWAQRMWCLFELAAFLKSKKDQKQELTIRPVFLGPASVAIFLVCFAASIPLPLGELAGSGGPVHALFVVSLVLLSGLMVGCMAVATLRKYFRDLDVMKSQLAHISLDATQCHCCDCNHVTRAGEAIICDREVVKDCIKVWFGSQEAFEMTVRSEVLEKVCYELDGRVFTARWALGVTMPVAWGIMDMAASEVTPELQWWDDNTLKWLIMACGVWLSLPSMWDLLILSCKLARKKSNTCGEIMRNIACLCILAFSIAFFGASFVFVTWQHEFFGGAETPRIQQAGVFIALMLCYALGCRCTATTINFFSK